MSKFLHGELVAFGSIVQTIAEDQPAAAVAAHAKFCHAIGLPVTLAQLGAANASEADLMAMAEATMAAPYIGNLRPAADAKRIAKCILAADAIGKTLG